MMMVPRSVLSIFSVLNACIFVAHAFSTPLNPSTRQFHPRAALYARPPSTVSDPAGPTPEVPVDEVEEVDPDTIDGLKDVRSASELPNPIPHQPWRRGDTAGCEDPIASPWRLEAEQLIRSSATMVGGEVLDITWYLTALVVTLNEDKMPPQDLLKSTGPVINIVEPTPPMYYDPNDPNPEPIWDDEDDVMYERETAEEAKDAENKLRNRFTTKDEDDRKDEPHIPDMSEFDMIPRYTPVETRSDIAVAVAEEEQTRQEELEQPIDIDTLTLDTAGLSTIARAITDALETREEDLQVLARHEVILTSPGPVDVLDTQRQFDAFRGSDVVVETQDPFQSNRTLKGKLVDRNSMDLMINKKGRLVTIPLNFVACVRLPPHELKGEFAVDELADLEP